MVNAYLEMEMEKTLNLEEYTARACEVLAINQKYQKMVKRLFIADRTVDYHVDCASMADSFDDRRTERKHLALEEKWFDKKLNLENELPKREVNNVDKFLDGMIQPPKVTAKDLKSPNSPNWTLPVEKLAIDEVEEVAKALLRTYLTNEATQPTINREFEACKVEAARILVRRESFENGQLSELGEHYSRVLIQLEES